MALAAGAAAAALLLSGCAAGEHAGTAKEVPVVDGGSAKLGTIALNAVTVVAPSANSYAQGTNARLQMYLTNSGQSDDQLLGATTTAANAVQSFADAAAASSGASSSASASPSTAASGSSSSCQPDAGFTPITVPAGGAVPIGYTDSQKVLQLSSLKGTLFPAQSLQVTFVFCHAGSVAVSIPVALTPGPSKTPTVDISPTEG